MRYPRIVDGSFGAIVPQTRIPIPRCSTSVDPRVNDLAEHIARRAPIGTSFSLARVWSEGDREAYAFVLLT